MVDNEAIYDICRRNLDIERPKSAGLCACLAIQRPLLRPGPGLTISLTSCTPRGPLSTGMLERVWRRQNSPRLGKILPPSRRTTRRSDSTLLRLEMTARATNTRLTSILVQL